MATDRLIDQHPHRDWPFRRSVAMRYGVAVLAVVAAFAIRYLIYGDILTRTVFTFFVPAALVAAWFGGLGAGILATVLGLLLGGFILLPPREALWPLANRDLMAMGVYAVTTAVCVILCVSLHHRIRRLEDALERSLHPPHADTHPDAHESPPHGVTTR